MINEDKLITEYVLKSEIKHILNKENLVANDIKSFIELKLNENSGIRYLLIFGDETHFPPIYSNEIPSDDYYSSLDGVLPTISTGRIPVSKSEDAAYIIDKIREYTLNLAPGIWKQKIMLTADDYRKQNYSANSEMRHTEYSEELYTIVKDYVIAETFFGAEYDAIPGDGWVTIPDLTNDIINNINQGTAVINYIGHGTFYGLADEKILLKDRDIDLINPIDHKYAIWVIGTCSFGHYDGEDSMPEELLNNPDGAIGIITTSRSVYTGTNIEFLRKIFLQFKEYIKGLNSNRLGDIVFFAKTNSNSSNYSLFHLFGDPALKLPFFIKDNLFNENEKNIIQLNNESLNVNLNTFDKNYISIKNKDLFSNITIEDNIYQILKPGNIIFNNQLDESFSFLLPLDAPPCDSCLQINIYSETENHVNKFDYSSNWSLIENNEFESDNEGPEISLSVNNNQIISGDLINIPTVLNISLFDQSGINTFGGIGHKIKFQLNDNSEIDITNNYEGLSETSGLISLPLSSYDNYQNTIKISVWDNYNNQTIKNYFLFFDDDSELTLKNIYPYPSPFIDEVEFTFHINKISNVEVKVFELSGKEIFSDSYSNLNPGLIRTKKWNGKMKNGSIISNGVYFFTVKATSIETKQSIQKIQKLAKIYK